MARLTVALGEQRYEVVRPWGELPHRLHLVGVSHVAVDSADRLYIYQRSDPPLIILDRSGKYVGGLGHGLLFDGHGIFIDDRDRVFVLDRDRHQLHVLAATGTVELSVGDPEHPRLQAPFNHPADVAVARNSDFYVADGYGNSRVHRFAPDGSLVASWGSPGKGPGQFTTPHAVWEDQQGRILVADRENDRVQLFTASGEYLTEWGDFFHPMDVWSDPAGMVYVTDQIPRLSMLSPDGTLVGRCRPVLFGAHGIWGDSVGDIYLAEAAPLDRVTKLVRI
jgi:peptidylglycine monooxygenase